MDEEFSKRVDEMYGEDSTNKKVKTTVKSPVTVKTISKRHKVILVDNTPIEIISEEYVNEIERRVDKLEKENKSSIAKINQLVRTINSLGADISKLSREHKRSNESIM